MGAIAALGATAAFAGDANPHMRVSPAQYERNLQLCLSGHKAKCDRTILSFQDRQEVDFSDEQRGRGVLSGPGVPVPDRVSGRPMKSRNPDHVDPSEKGAIEIVWSPEKTDAGAKTAAAAPAPAPARSLAAQRAAGAPPPAVAPAPGAPAPAPAGAPALPPAASLPAQAAKPVADARDRKVEELKAAQAKADANFAAQTGEKK